MSSKPLEKVIEKTVVRYAQSRGCIVRKLNGMGARSWPDRMFLGPHGRVLFIEFKREGGEATKLQHHFHTQMSILGHLVAVIDDVEVGKALIELLITSRISPLLNKDKAKERLRYWGSV